MLSFKFFNTDKSEKVRVKVESNNESLVDIHAKADKACITPYNSTVVSLIKANMSLLYKA